MRRGRTPCGSPRPRDADGCGGTRATSGGEHEQHRRAFIVAGGGTGGHLFPGMAVVRRAATSRSAAIEHHAGWARSAASRRACCPPAGETSRAASRSRRSRAAVPRSSVLSLKRVGPRLTPVAMAKGFASAREEVRARRGDRRRWLRVGAGARSRRRCMGIRTWRCSSRTRSVGLTNRVLARRWSAART
jgi:hypothetical protein